MFSFLALWFNNLRKNVFKVEVINNSKDDTKNLESKLDEVVQALKELPEERSDITEKRMKEYIVLTKALDERKTQKVEVTNLKYPELKIPKDTQVHGSVSVSNLPKVQEVSGDINVREFPNLLKGIQVVVDTINDLKLDFAQSFKGFGNSFASTAGSREAIKITDGSKNATLTTSGSKNLLDVNIASSSAGGDATAANQATMITSLANIDSDTSAIQTAVETIDNAVSGAGFNITQQGGVAISLNTGVRDSGTQRVTIATNDAVPITDNSSSLTVDGNVGSSTATGTTVPANAFYIGGNNSAGNLGGVSLNINGMNSSGNTALQAMHIAQFDDTSPTSITENQFGNVRMSANRNLYGTIRDAAGNERGLNVDASGQIAITVASIPSHAVTNAGTFVTQATLQAGTAEVGKLAAGIAEIGNVKNSGTFATQATLQAGSAAIGKLAANSGVDIGDVDITSIATGTNAIGRVGHDITGIGHGVTTVTTAGTDVVLAASTACKRVVIQSQTDNTNLIAVGATGVDATIATGNGVVLYPGDAFELEIDNLNDVYIDSLVNGEGVRYTYFT